MKFRRAVAVDVALVDALSHRAYAKWVPILGRPPKPMIADHGQAIRDHIIDILIDEAGVAIGLVEIIPAADHWLIENVVVDPPAQGRGHGKRLVAHAEDLTRAAGLTTIRLYTNKLFAENITLYQRLGYVIDSEEPFKGGYLVNMSKRLRTL